jgi:hypothetical protein
MKKPFTLLATLLLITAGCGENNPPTDAFITVDVTASYPKKELILQDFMDVEYIPLETTDEFLTQGFVQAVGKNIIVVVNRNDDGDIFIFDRKTGKGVKKINRKGQGAEEYTDILGIILDEDKDEIFVNDIFMRKILVYDLEGNFKRSFKQKENTMYDIIYNFDRENLICNDGFFNNDGEANRQPFMIISKQDGSITKEISIPFKEKKSTIMILTDEAKDITYSISPSTYYPIIPYFDNWILIELSSDTVYRYLPDHTMTPFIVKTPSIQSMNPEVFLFLSMLTERYYFMEAVKKVYDWQTNDGFSSTDLIYDKQEKAVFKYTVYNDDYSNKKQVYMKSRPVNEEITTRQPLEAYELIEDYKAGKLKGKLKEIAAELDEDSNPVIMLIKHKK